jgi:glycosyltransferase involved in cell wall biosynthesis
MTERLSIVIPVFNEAESLPELQQQLQQMASAWPDPVNWVYVDDGSTDDSWAQICRLARDSPQTQGIRFRRNFGKAAALSAGFQATTGTLVAMLDADLQDDPAELPRMAAKLQDGWDFINGWKAHRQDPWHKVYPSWVFNAMIGRLSGLWLHDHNCGLKLFRRSVVDEIRLYGELHRFIPVLAHGRGFRVTELAVHHRPRVHGHSKYGFRRFRRGFLDLLTVAFLVSYRQRPQHMLGSIGLTCLLLGLAGLTYLAVLWGLMNVVRVWPPEPIGQRPLLLYSVAAAVLGGQALSLGLIAELLVYFHSARSDTRSSSSGTSEAYSIAEQFPAER